MRTSSARWACEKLLGIFGPVSARRYRGNPLDELIGTILSQSTTDTNSARAYASLRKRFPTWECARVARTSQIAAAIRSGGLAVSKSRFIKNALNAVHQREGRLSLRRLSRLSDEEAILYLTDIPGVGIKTASCVLLFAMGRPAFPVDTHVFRVTRRLGWLPQAVAIEKASAFLKRHVPDELALPLHLYLVWHGRRTCRSQRPTCKGCVLRTRCTFAMRAVAAPKRIKTRRAGAASTRRP